MHAELHESSFISLLAAGFVLALLFGIAANIPSVMFGVGMHFSIKDLMSVRRSALPGAIRK